MKYLIWLVEKMKKINLLDVYKQKLEHRFGTQLDKKGTEQSQMHITAMLWVPS
jgi:hypothetical protein